jgi:hypothetical protein
MAITNKEPGSSPRTLSAHCGLDAQASPFAVSLLLQCFAPLKSFMNDDMFAARNEVGEVSEPNTRDRARTRAGHGPLDGILHSGRREGELLLACGRKRVSVSTLRAGRQPSPSAATGAAATGACSTAGAGAFFFEGHSLIATYTPA